MNHLFNTVVVVSLNMCEGGGAHIQLPKPVKIHNLLMVAGVGARLAGSGLVPGGPVGALEICLT